MKTNRRPAFLALATLAVAVAVAPGCSNDSAVTGPDNLKTARVMVIHASPNAPAVDVLVDNAVVASNVPFGVNSSYLNPPAGLRNFKINVAGTSTTVINVTPRLEPGFAYSAFAVDSVASIEPLLLVDDLAIPAAGKAHVRFVHLSPNAPAVDVAVTGGPVLFPGYSFKQASAFTPFNAGTYNLEVRLAGTTNVVLTVPGVTLSDRNIYTIWAAGFVGGAGAQALSAKAIVNFDND